jgi:hypothetical protein
MGQWEIWACVFYIRANLAAIQMLKEYLAAEIGVGEGEIIAASKGLHLYDYVWELAKLRALNLKILKKTLLKTLSALPDQGSRMRLPSMTATSTGEGNEVVRRYRSLYSAH